MIKRYLSWSFAAVILSLSACGIDNDVPDPTPPITAGTANFTRYIAVGNSLAAGYTNGGLYQAGQVVAYPNLLAGQFALAGGGSFTSPLFPANQPNGTGYLKLSGMNSDGTPNITQVAPQSVRGTTTIAGVPVTLYTKYTGALNNYGVPGIKVANVLDPTYGNFNGYYERLLAGNAGTNITPYLTFATANAYTFFTLELGSNDALDYATSDGTTASRALTDQTVFAANYLTTLNRLNTGNRQGVVATIPDVTVLPFFHYITIATVQAAAVKNTGFTGLANAAVYIQALNANGTYSVRQATAADDIMLTLNLSGIASGGSEPYALFPTNPIPSSLVLDAREIANVQAAITGYNNSIRSAASTLNLPVLDAYALFNQLQNGVLENGVTINTNFLTGGVFSLDGIHLTPRGNAAVTNEFIKVINAKYGSNLPGLDISKYGGAGSN